MNSVRPHFPALQRTHNGRPVAYFDGPGGTQVPRMVVDAMTQYLLHHNANTHWVYPTSLETDAKLLAARETIADFLNASPREVSFANNMTTGTFHLARALGRTWGPGDEIVVTELDHHANIAPWRALERERGLTIRKVKVDTTRGELDWSSLEDTLSQRTKLLAIGAGSNALGTVTDVAAAARLAHDVGALVYVDAVHYAPHHLVDVKAFDCDFLGCSAYKFYGPHVGIIFGKEAQLGRLDVPKLEPAPEQVPERMETGTQNHEGIVGAAAAVEFLASLGEGATRRDRLASAFHTLHEDGMTLVRRLWDGLGTIPGVTRYGPGPDRPRTPTVSFTVDGVKSDDVAKALVKHAVFVSSGDFYATTLVRLLGHGDDGLVRVGAACYTTMEEIERLLAAVSEVAKR
ncbi:cysteine desulfurase-like protein [Pseudogemmatithrix spongiicola]|uniref:Cysteine desulfurase-like protein n=1 Tax=Pseudogemmatithrix spongiicola TaxID=3062599 RepID=A0AA49K2A7_9BACT|nr:cysteine desulfurase-like protein [Gemmatimonadaceae bacterium 'strain 138']WKW16097.1 cysteine desulfurase-like protein [Gemmatimonadaceae bacterium 'strain 318']